MTSPTDPLYSALLVLDRSLMQEAKAAWYALQLNNLQASFEQEFLPRMLPRLVTAQTAAAALGAKNIVAQVPPKTIDYRKPGQSKLLPSIAVHPLPVPQINPAAFAGVASDGRALDSLLAQPLINVYRDVDNGMPGSLALRTELDSLDRILTTQVQDAARVAESVTMVAHRVTYYIRVVEPGACGPCIALAGTHYKVNAGFLRHPRCRCHHEMGTSTYLDPLDGSARTVEHSDQSFAQTPREIFDSLTTDEQNIAFTVDGAQAIRDGASISQVVNARRGMNTTAFQVRDPITKELVTRNVATPRDVYGRQLLTTTEGVTGRGQAGRVITARGRNAATTPRLMPEAIYQLAGDDLPEIMRLLRANGFLIN